MGYGYPYLFKGVATSAAGDKYVGVPIRRGTIGLQIAWKDATSNATLTLEITNFPESDAPYEDAGAAWEWEDSGVSITGPSATAADSTIVQLENVRAARARLKISPTADSDLEIRDNPNADSA